MPTPTQALALWLDERCAFLRHLETEAGDVLQKQGDQERYRQLMQQKALFLSALPDEAADLVKALPGDKAMKVADQLAAFQRGAENALGLGSVFYMSALLYPEDHQQGDPNDLERWLRDLEKNLSA